MTIRLTIVLLVAPESILELYLIIDIYIIVFILNRQKHSRKYQVRPNMVANQNGISSSQGQKICFQIAGFEFMNKIHDIADPDDEDLKKINNSIIMLTKTL